MTMIDYLLLGGVAAAAIYTAYRLLRGWRNSALMRDDSEGRRELNAPLEMAPGNRLATGAPWGQRAKEQLNESDFKN